MKLRQKISFMNNFLSLIKRCLCEMFVIEVDLAHKVKNSSDPNV